MGKKKVVEVRLQEVKECAKICGVDGLEIDHHREAEDTILDQLSKTPVDRFVDQIRDRQKETLARVTDSMEWLE